MQYRKDRNGNDLSILGYGCMRFTRKGNGLDIAKAEKELMTAYQAGVNYYDTAWGYHGGNSERVMGEVLADYPRESFYLATKFPGHQNVHGVKPLLPEEVFEEQLQKCGVDFFDFYLIHNVNENSLAYYGNPENRFMDYFVEQKKNGRIKHLGFSCHAAPAGLKRFLELYGEHMDFCQIQLNFVDWKLQEAEKKCEILKAAGLPVWVMEPVRGGKLAHFAPEIEAKMKALRPDESIAAWAFRWLQTLPKPTMVLSGMSASAQMEDNIRTFSDERPLNEAELAVLEEIAERLSGSIPCTACRYCCAGCPVGLDIPNLMALANEYEVGGNTLITVMRYSGLGDGKRADDCIGCGQCQEICPQKIAVPEEMRKLAAAIRKEKSWEEICLEREKAMAAEK